MTAPWVAAFVALWLLLGVVAVAVLGLVRLQGADRPHAHDARPPDEDLARVRTGDRPDAFVVASVDGERITTASLPERSLLVTEPGCPPCERILAQIATVEPGVLAHLVVVVGDLSGIGAGHRASGAVFVHDTDRSVTTAFGAHGSPILFDLDRSGTVRRVHVPSGVADLHPAPHTGVTGPDEKEDLDVRVR